METNNINVIDAASNDAHAHAIFLKKKKAFLKKRGFEDDDDTPFSERLEWLRQKAIKKMEGLPSSEVLLAEKKANDAIDNAKRIALEIERRQRKRLPISLQDAKKSYWYWLQKLIEQENKGLKEKIVFKVDNSNKRIIQNLVAYLIGEECDWDLGKGLFFYGEGKGQGKTTLMRAASLFLKELSLATNDETLLLNVVSCKDIVREVVSNKDIEVSFKYQYNKYCFDDLGFEEKCTVWGTKYNVMTEILTKRYDAMQRTGLLTFCTSNKFPCEITETYGTRVGSRFAQMFNVVEFETTRDYRKEPNYQ